MKKLLVLALFVLLACPLYSAASSQSDVVFDLLGNYTRQLSSPTVNMKGGTIVGAYLFNKQIGLDGYFSLATYKSPDAGAANAVFSFQDYNYGAGVRLYILPDLLYLKIRVGRLTRKCSDAGSTLPNSDWRLGTGVAYSIPIGNRLGINVGMDFYRYTNSKTNLLEASAGLTIKI